MFVVLYCYASVYFASNYPYVLKKQITPVSQMDVMCSRGDQRADLLYLWAHLILIKESVKCLTFLMIAVLFYKEGILRLPASLVKSCYVIAFSFVF